MARTLLLAVALLAHSILAHPMSSRSIAYSSKRILAFGLGRREALQKASIAVVGGISFLGTSPALADGIDGEHVLTTTATTGPSFAAYSVTPDSSEFLSPSLQAIDQDNLFTALSSSSKGGVVWLGEHHNSQKDHMIQVDIINKLHAVHPSSSPMAIGLEQVQVQFQPALDDYVSGKISVEKMKELVQWEMRWTWPFDNYRPIFETCRDLGIRLIALNVDSEDLALVEKAGFPGLGQSQLQKYITDPNGFAAFARPVEFRTYVDYVIRPSYDMHRYMGLLKYTNSGQKLEQDMPFRNFFSGRILWDEAMASAANAWTTANPGGLMIGLVGADHVKFQDGIPGRYARMAGTSRDSVSVILNPTLIDTTPPGAVGSIANSDSSQNPNKIILQLRYLKDNVDGMSPDRVLPASTGGVLALADYLIIS